MYEYQVFYISSTSLCSIPGTVCLPATAAHFGCHIRPHRQQTKTKTASHTAAVLLCTCAKSVRSTRLQTASTRADSLFFVGQQYMFNFQQFRYSQKQPVSKVSVCACLPRTSMILLHSCAAAICACACVRPARPAGFRFTFLNARLRRTLCQRNGG